MNLSSGKTLGMIGIRLRPALGSSVGLLLFTSILLSGVQSINIFVILGIGFIHLFGDLYNDLTDIEEDQRNGRMEKLTLNGIFTHQEIQFITLCALIFGYTLTLIGGGVIWLSLGFAYSITLFSYSYQKIRLKSLGVFGYFITFFPLFSTPLIISDGQLYTKILLMLFLTSYTLYIMCQKDSTDTHDVTNVFLAKGWSYASILCLFYGSLTIITLAILAAIKPMLWIGWPFFSLPIFLNVYLIKTRKIQRPMRKRIITMQFLSLYILSICAL